VQVNNLTARPTESSGKIVQNMIQTGGGSGGSLEQIHTTYVGS
jgi:hypothetical protein